MKGQYIGELEELILLTIGILHPEAYGVSVLQKINEQTGREVNISAIHSVMNRLEKKGMLKSHMGGAEQIRGGRRKRYYTLSAAGRATLDEVKQMRDRLYHQLPSVTFPV